MTSRVNNETVKRSFFANIKKHRIKLGQVIKEFEALNDNFDKYLKNGH